MKPSQLPQPRTEAFNKLGPEARTLARAIHNYQPLTQNRGESMAQAKLQDLNQEASQ